MPTMYKICVFAIFPVIASCNQSIVKEARRGQGPSGIDKNTNDAIQDSASDSANNGTPADEGVLDETLDCSSLPIEIYDSMDSSVAIAEVEQSAATLSDTQGRVYNLCNIQALDSSPLMLLFDYSAVTNENLSNAVLKGADVFLSLARSNLSHLFSSIYLTANTQLTHDQGRSMLPLDAANRSFFYVDTELISTLTTNSQESRYYLITSNMKLYALDPDSPPSAIVASIEQILDPNLNDNDRIDSVLTSPADSLIINEVIRNALINLTEI